MKANMGTVDRLVRVLIALTVGILYLIGQISGIAAVVLGVVSVVLLATGLVSFCPLYAPFRISTKTQE